MNGKTILIVEHIMDAGIVIVVDDVKKEVEKPSFMKEIEPYVIKQIPVVATYFPSKEPRRHWQKRKKGRNNQRYF